MNPTTYTDERLTADLAITSSPGPARRAAILLAIPAHLRDAAVAEAHYMDNMIGGRPSDNLDRAAGYVVSGQRLASPLARSLMPQM